MFLFPSAASCSPWTRCVIPSTNKPQPGTPSVVKRPRRQRFSFALLRNQWWSWCHCFVNTLTPFFKTTTLNDILLRLFLKHVFKMSCTFAVKTLWMKRYSSWFFIFFSYVFQYITCHWCVFVLRSALFVVWNPLRWWMSDWHMKNHTTEYWMFAADSQ